MLSRSAPREMPRQTKVSDAIFSRILDTAYLVMFGYQWTLSFAGIHFALPKISIGM